ncbi:MAG TPA: preprotein translocase subunit SecE [Firmicutes bacterium]|uniref:Protein translocase subunit SecE n=1 Tax=Capillibacterium thermochitinicola TaxID=2699427 RepID=A0A8J6HYM2_9FIRM|nr:preprotein translocase subunit SecE [Capillibacterium thermochitinicola]MBA2133977.1 preprotein translocase subunit SecE [Capillibacterium thermochitinicola]HHW12672.1 preprotein translocase subunit SecE [Bacillota bacterium]
MAEKKRRVSVGKFFRSVAAEMKKVAWPNRKEVSTYTTVVLVTVAAVALLISIFDSILSLILFRIK